MDTTVLEHSSNNTRSTYASQIRQESILVGVKHKVVAKDQEPTYVSELLTFHNIVHDNMYHMCIIGLSTE